MRGSALRPCAKGTSAKQRAVWTASNQTAMRGGEASARLR
ncbi:hypothetical protein Z950_762 [Sulfitobacter mediterraneus KCTC 32188]|nr:hypothetical protein Z950_762 [Sulfitobacter mediterraneus KCTC 32188]